MPEKDREKRPIYTRREFLRSAVMATGAMIAAPILLSPAGAAAAALAEKSTAKSWRAGSPTRLGVLLPESNIYPGLGTSFLAGMRAYQRVHSDNSQGGELLVIPETVGFGPQRLLQKAEKLLREDKANLLIGLLTPSVATRLDSILEANQTLLIAASMGENLPRQSEQHPSVFYHTLAGWQSNYALGEWAARKLGHRAFIATSFYDSGYDSLYAFRLGFERGGGVVAQTHTVGLPGEPEGMDALVAAIVQAQPDFVYGAFCGQTAIDFVAAYAHRGLSRRIPLVGSAFMVDQDLLSKQGTAALGIKTAFSSPAADNPENGAFLAAYRYESRLAPGPFALLGYETAQLVTEALNSASADVSQVRDLKATLSTAEITGPRGGIAMNPATQSTSGGPLYLREVQRQDGELRNVVVENLDSTPDKDARVQTLRNSAKTGWLNAYLSA
jgi:branched-chain amino acid transport system substrate-binding protein